MFYTNYFFCQRKLYGQAITIAVVTKCRALQLMAHGPKVGGYTFVYDPISKHS